MEGREPDLDAGVGERALNEALRCDHSAGDILEAPVITRERELPGAVRGRELIALAMATRSDERYPKSL